MENQEAKAAEQTQGPRIAFASVEACLIAARKRIENPVNWAGGGRKDESTHRVFCVTTAMTCQTPEMTRDERVVCDRAIKLFVNQNGLGDEDNFLALNAIWQWNDAPERTHAEVLAAFDKAIVATDAVGDRLSAAPPDMLAALEKIEQQLDYGQIDAALRIARAAITKATGGA